MDNFFSLRFFVAPILSLMFIVGAMQDVLIGNVVGSIESSLQLEVAGLFILMSGFLVAAVAAFLINVFRLDVITFDGHELELLSTRYSFMQRELKKTNNARELAEWLIMEETGSEYVREQVQARWSLFVVYFTSFIALTLIVLPAITFLGATPHTIWWCVYLMFVGIFCFNSYYFFRAVNLAVRLMLRRLAEPHDVPTIVH
jgi:hypothetical protein